MAVGVHILSDMYGVSPNLIERKEPIGQIVEEAVRVGGLTKISSDFYQFDPIGASGIILLAESHLSFHTWPEHGLVTLDLYTCGDPSKAEIAYEYILENLMPTSVSTKRVERGKMIGENINIIQSDHTILV